MDRHIVSQPSPKLQPQPPQPQQQQHNLERLRSNRRGASTPLCGVEACMLSSKQAAQPNPSSPALCRRDTTSPWSTDHSKKKNNKNGTHEKREMKNTKAGSPPNGPFLILEFSQKEIFIFYNRNCSTMFFLVLACARTTEKSKKKEEKRKKNKKRRKKRKNNEK